MPSAREAATLTYWLPTRMILLLSDGSRVTRSQNCASPAIRQRRATSFVPTVAIASLISILYQSTEAEKPGRNCGVTPGPGGKGSGFSGLIFGFPPEKVGIW